MTISAVQLVNRVRRRLNYGDTGGITDDIDVAILDLVNEAARHVLDANDWDFDARHDGILHMVPVLEGTIFSPGSDNTFVFAVAGDTTLATTYGLDRVIRMRVTSDSTYGSESFICLDVAQTGTGVTFTLETDWPGDAYTVLSPGTASIFCAEYLLPDTVKDVLSVRHEENELALTFVDRTTQLEQCVPDFGYLESSEPTSVFAGSSLQETTLESSTADYRTGLMVHPVPSNAYVLRYSYRYQHPEITTTQSLENVPDRVVDDIVQLAFVGAASTHIANDPDLAKLNRQTFELSLERARGSDGSQPNRRRSMRSHDRRRDTRFFNRPENMRQFD